MATIEISRILQNDLSVSNGKIVLIALAEHANQHGHCWPSLRRLASLSSLSRRTVITVIGTLEGAGAVYVNRRSKRNEYVITFALSQKDIISRLRGAFQMAAHEAEKVADEIVSKRAAAPTEAPEKPARKKTIGEESSPTGLVQISHPHGEEFTPMMVKNLHLCGEEFAPPSESSIEPIQLNPPVEAEAAPQPEPQKAAAAAAFAAAVKIYEQEISVSTTPLIAQEIEDWLKDAPAEFVELAIKQAARSGNRRWSYVVGILRRCQQENWREKPGERKPTPSSAPPPRNGAQMPGVVRKLSDIKRRPDQINRTPIIIEGRIGDA